MDWHQIFNIFAILSVVAAIIIAQWDLPSKDGREFLYGSLAALSHVGSLINDDARDSKWKHCFVVFQPQNMHQSSRKTSEPRLAMSTLFSKCQKFCAATVFELLAARVANPNKSRGSSFPPCGDTRQDLRVFKRCWQNTPKDGALWK